MLAQVEQLVAGRREIEPGSDQKDVDQPADARCDQRAAELDRLIGERGEPKTIVSDTRTEFISIAILTYADGAPADPDCFAPAKPTHDGIIVTPQSRLPDESTSETLVSSLVKARAAPAT